MKLDNDTIILSDLHGCYWTMTRLLNNAPTGLKIVFAGDLIDRGPHSRKVVEFAMENGIPTTLGNHCDLCLAFYRHKSKCAVMYDRDVWLDNGGCFTTRNWLISKTNDRRASHMGAQDDYVGGRVPDPVLDWMAALPAYLLPSSEPDSEGRQLMVSHTGYGLSANPGTDDWFQALWGRYPDDGPFPEDNYYRVFGHTTVKKAKVEPRFCNIDTGCAYPKRDGILSAILWPSKTIITQPFNEAPIDSNFTVQNGCITR